jgi:formylglycine-generating enzyme required for sulfatase activity
MASPDNEPELRGKEGPRHKVTIGRFAVSKTAVTREQFEKFVNATGHQVGDKCLTRKEGRWAAEPGRTFKDPGFAQGGNHPAVCVSFEDVKAYLAWLSKQAETTYRLLSEAEWEYVARAGSDTPFWWGAKVTPAQANYNGNVAFAGGSKGDFRQKTVPAYDSFKLNPWNLFIGEGNAAEWVEDCWNKNYQGAPPDGSAWTKGECGSRGAVATSKPKRGRTMGEAEPGCGIRRWRASVQRPSRRDNDPRAYRTVFPVLRGGRIRRADFRSNAVPALSSVAQYRKCQQAR